MSRGSNRGLGIDWNFPWHEGLINNRGETVIHEIGMRCTCNLEDTMTGQIESGAHVPRKRKIVNCDICDGLGYIFRRGRKIVAIITGIRERKDQLEGGWAYPGDCMMSVKLDYQITGGDLIMATWPQAIPDGQVIKRGAGTDSDNSSRKTNLDSDEDRLWYHAASVIHCEDENGVVYEEGDFVIDTSKVIRWTGQRPQKGTIYTIKYNAYLEWIAFLPPEIRRDRDRDLGTRVGLRKRHVALVNDDPTVRASDRVVFCDRTKACS